MLALEAGKVVPVSRLVDGVWGDPPPDTVTTALQGHVSQLRRVLGDEAIETRAPGYRLAVEAEAVDAIVCGRALERARAQLANGDARAALGELEAAQALWRGAALADVADAPFAPDALPALEELRVGVAEERHEAELALGRHVEAVPSLRALVGEHPLRERPRAQLMVALYRAGRQAEALDVYAEGRRVLADELGIDPGERLRALHEAIVRQDPDLRGDAPVRPPRTESPVPVPRRHRRAAAAAVLLAGLAAAVALARGDQDDARTPSIRTGVVRVDARTLRANLAVSLQGNPGAVAAAGDRAWVLDEDAQTITAVGARPRTFATGTTPVDLAAAAGDLWVAGGQAGATQFRGPQVHTLVRVDGGTGGVRGSIPLEPDASAAPATDPQGRVAASGRSLSVIRADGAVAQVEAARARVTRVLRVQAHAVATDAGGAWVLTVDGTLVSYPASGAQGAPVSIDLVEPGSVAAGGGAVWVTDAAQGRLWRVEAGRAERVRGVTAPGAIAYGAGGLWISQPQLRAVQRLDPDEGRVTATVQVGGIPRDVATAGTSVWITVDEGDRSTAACGPLQQAPGGRPGPVVVLDLPLRAGARSAAGPMSTAALAVARRRGFRAGRHRIGVRLCDDSSARTGNYDPLRCRANAEAYAADPRVVIEVGPLNSGCAHEQVGPAARAPLGPLAIASPTNTDPLLTRDVRPRLRGAYVRVAPRDDRLLAAAARRLRERGARRVYLLTDGAGGNYGAVAGSFFLAGARAAGLRVAGRASWQGRRLRQVMARVRRAHPDAVWVSGLLDNRAGEVVAAVRATLGPGVIIGGPEGLLPVATLFRRAGAAARGVLIAAPFPRGPEAQASAAMEVALDAVARSDGSRAGVARAVRATRLADSAVGPVAFDAAGDRVAATGALVRARRGGGSVVNGSTEGSEPVTALPTR